jgi:hypothetical protein
MNVAGAIVIVMGSIGKNITADHKDQARMTMLGEHYIKVKE